jgi:hypothetical protein
MSLLGLTGQSSTRGLCLLDRPVEPGDDSKVCVNLSEKRFSGGREFEPDVSGASPTDNRRSAPSLRYFCVRLK